VNVKFDSPILHVTPNPMTSAGSQVAFRIPNGSVAKNIRIDLYGIDGRRIQTLLEATYAGGTTGSVWLSGEHIAAGVYFLHLTSDGESVESARVQRIR
jgi:hypothetical protein